MKEVSTSLKSFSNKTKSPHFSFATCFIICKFILIYFLLARKSKWKQGTYASSLTEYKFNSLEFFEFQKQIKKFFEIIYTLSKMKIKNHDSFLSLHCCCLVAFSWIYGQLLMYWCKFRLQKDISNRGFVVLNEI